MSKKLQLQINDPCHENWENMTPDAKGRFCSSCQKDVIDFSTMSDRQIAQFFKKPSTGSVCGRFMDDQLNRDIVVPKKRIPWVKYFFQFTLPAFLVTARANAQGKVSVIPVVKVTDQPICTPTMGMIARPTGTVSATKSSVINGQVADADGLPIPNASILNEKTHITIVADSTGTFSFKSVPSKEMIRLKVTAIGFEDTVYTFSNRVGNISDITIQMVKDVQQLDEVTVVAYGITKGKIVTVGTVARVTPQKLQSPKRDTIIQKLTAKYFSPFISIFPNPVKAGASLHIEWKKTETGTFSLQLLNQGGQLVFSNEMWIDEDARLLEMQVPRLPAGSYFLRLSSRQTGRSFTEKLIIE